MFCNMGDSIANKTKMRELRPTGSSAIPFVALLVCLGLLVSGQAAAQTPLKGGARVETDLFFWPESPPSALLDGDIKTHFNLARVLDSEWRMWFASPLVPERLEVVQGYENWSTATELTLEDARGTVITVPLAIGTRDVQVIALPFTEPSAFIDVRVSAANTSQTGETYGGLASMQFIGAVRDEDTTPPVISNVQVIKESPATATVVWTTDEPATAQVRFSQQDNVSATTAPTTELSTEHQVALLSSGPLVGQIEIRATDAAGNRRELRYDAFTTMSPDFQFGVGGWSFEINGKWERASAIYKRDDFRVDTMQIWLGGYDWNSWFDSATEIRKVHDDGYIPEIISFYFGYPEVAELKDRRADYLAKITFLAEMLRDSGVGGEAIVTLEPEYNQGEVASLDAWNDLMIEAINVLHSIANAKVGLLPGPWDLAHKVPLSMGRAAAYADFIAFQGMKASTKNTPQEAHAMVDDSIRFAHFLNRRFMKPVRWGYWMVSDYGGWRGVQQLVAIETCERLPELQAAGVTALSIMGYLDHPDSNGALEEAESYLGIKNYKNEPKPAWYVWQECIANGASWLKTGQPPPGGVPEPLPSGNSSGCGCRMAREYRGVTGTFALVVMGLFALVRRVLANSRRRSCQHGAPQLRPIVQVQEW